MNTSSSSSNKDPVSLDYSKSYMSSAPHSSLLLAHLTDRVRMALTQMGQDQDLEEGIYTGYGRNINTHGAMKHSDEGTGRGRGRGSVWVQRIRNTVLNTALKQV